MIYNDDAFLFVSRSSVHSNINLMLILHDLCLQEGSLCYS